MPFHASWSNASRDVCMASGNRTAVDNRLPVGWSVFSASVRNASTYFSMTGPLSSWRASAASASKWMATSLLPRTMRAPSCLRSSISFSFNTDGMRTDRSKFLPFNERTSTVYFLEPTAPSAFPYPVIERSMPRRYAPTPWGPFRAGEGAVLPCPGATFVAWRNPRQAFDTCKRF